MAILAHLIEAPPVRHRPERRELRRQSKLRTSTDRVHDAVICNISAQGALATCRDALAPDSEIVLDLGDAGLIPAKLVWQSDDFYGLSFIRPLESGRLERALHADNVIWANFGQPGKPAFIPAGPPPTVDAAIARPANEKWPLGARVALILATASFCWLVIGAAIFLAVR